MHQRRQEAFPAATPSHLLGFIWRVSATDQLWLAVLSLFVFAAGIVPLELQRRIVNNAIVGGSIEAIVGLAGTYVFGSGTFLGSGVLGD